MGLHRKFNYFKQKLVLTSFFLTSIIAGVTSDDNIVGKLPFCDTDINDQRANSRRYVIIICVLLKYISNVLSKQN